MTILTALLDIDAALEREGVPPISPYWRGEAERFYRHASARLLVECVGRGGDKSRTSTKMAIAEVLAGSFRVPPGERHYFTHVAENRDEAAKTLAVLEQYLRILRVGFARSSDTIELQQLPLGFKVLACRVGAVSGWRCIGWTADECAKWDNEGTDPSTEVIASIRAMTVTHPEARGRMFSSPLGILGHFYDTWIRGDAADQVVGHAASWEANPSITEERTRQLERDERKWQREYKAVPTQETDQSMFTAVLLDRVTRATPGDVPKEGGVTYVAAMDPGYVRNPWTFVIAGKRLVGNRVKRSVVLAREWRGTDAYPNDPRRILREIAPLCRLYGIDGVYTDQYEKYGLQAIAEEPEIAIGVWVRDQNATARLASYEALLMEISDDEVELPKHEQLRADLLAVRQRLTPNGFTVHLPQTPDGRHADFASSVTLAIANCRIDPEVVEVVYPTGSPEYYAKQCREWEERQIAQLEARWQAENEEARYWRDFYGIDIG
jgi:hypothetical protein